MLGLQRLLYGPLRPIEIEQLYEKAWFAVTETCLAMTIFREEVGGWFLVMFVALLVGKVWGWIGEGRVEILEQQPPANPRLFHARLSTSLVTSALFDLYMLNYCVQTVLQQARPNMMVMFAFEFAVLAVASLSTAARYTIILHEAAVIKGQTNTRLNERRVQLGREREEARQQANNNANNAYLETPATMTNEELEELEIDVPGWEEKGRWVFYLDLTTGKSKLIVLYYFMRPKLIMELADFFKLVLYLTFFCVLCMFYGMPIHIIRDVALTIRSFYKRITDFVRYRQATRDMNERYPDATSEEVAGEDVCIICRETMRAWHHTDRQGIAPDGSIRPGPPTLSATDERLRPKKLPCGHVLHFACLRSWLERQQNCPTCRQSVLVPSTNIQNVNPHGPNQQIRAQAQLNLPQDGVPVHGGAREPARGQHRIRTFNLGPFRLGFGAGQGIEDLAQHLNNGNVPPRRQAPAPGNENGQRIGFGFGFGRQPAAAQFSPLNTQAQLHNIEQQIIQEINSLRLQADQLYMVRLLQGELARLRIAQAPRGPIHPGELSAPYQNRLNNAQLNAGFHGSTVQAFGQSPDSSSMSAAHQDLPQGLILPEGWTLLPLQRLPSGVNQNMPLPTNIIQDRELQGATNNSHDTHRLRDQQNPHFPSSFRRLNVNDTPIPLTSNSAQEATASEQNAPAGQLAEEVAKHHLNSESKQPGSENRLSSPSHRDDLRSDPPDPTAEPPARPSSNLRAASEQRSDTTGPARSRGPDRNHSNEYSQDGNARRSGSQTPSGETDFERRDAKGKGRAVTVEDYAEDVD